VQFLVDPAPLPFARSMAACAGAGFESMCSRARRHAPMTTTSGS